MNNGLDCDKEYIEDWVREIYSSSGQQISKCAAQPIQIGGNGGGGDTVGSATRYYVPGDNGGWLRGVGSVVQPQIICVGALSFATEVSAYTSGTFMANIDLIMRIAGGLQQTRLYSKFYSSNLADSKIFDRQFVTFNGLALSVFDGVSGLATVQLNAKFDGWKVTVY